eukprot:COSAG01_NODE_99_length_26583_cov_79.512536_11_plen_138_part_00
MLLSPLILLGRCQLILPHLRNGVAEIDQSRSARPVEVLIGLLLPCIRTQQCPMLPLGPAFSQFWRHALASTRCPIALAPWIVSIALRIPVATCLHSRGDSVLSTVPPHTSRILPAVRANTTSATVIAKSSPLFCCTP